MDTFTIGLQGMPCDGITHKPSDSAAGLEVCPMAALNNSILGMCGVPIVCLTTTVGVSARAIRTAEDQLRLASFTSGKHSVFDLSLDISNEEIKLGSSCDVEVGHDRVAKCVKVEC